MAEIIDLTQGKWRLHTRLWAVNNWINEMGTPLPQGENTDVLFTFKPAPADLAGIAAQLAAVAPGGLEATWYKACFEPSPDVLDTEASRGEHWARVFPGAQSGASAPLVQIVQMNWAGVEGSLRIFIGRWVSGNPTTFFGHGTGNDATGAAHSFTLKKE